VALNIKYKPLEEDAKKISELVIKQRFRNHDAFMDRAIQVLLAWELDPMTSMDIMKGYPQTEEQKQTLQAMLQPEIYKENFGEKINQLQSALDSTKSPKISEDRRLAEKFQTNDDFKRLIANMPKTKLFIKNLEVSEPVNKIKYDGYPILSRFYTRFAPAKIVLCVLADLLRQNPNSEKVDLEVLRVDALDIATEAVNEIIKFEQINGIKRNRKISTGFPKLNQDKEHQVSIHRRFRNQYVGKIRKERKKEGEEGRHEFFEGILSALGLVYATRENGRTMISLTQKGKEFYLIDNPILNEDFSHGLSKKESEYIFDVLILQIPLERQLWESALQIVKNIEHDPKLEGKYSKLLEESTIESYENWIRENPKEAKKFRFDSIEYVINEVTHEEKMEEIWAKYIQGWRVAVMGRLSELNKIKWNIQPETGKSVFKLMNTL